MERHGLGVVDPFTASLIIGGAQMGIAAIFNRKGGIQKEYASRAVEDVAQELDRVVATWNQLEPKTAALQQQFLSVVLNAMDGLERALLNPQLGDAGKRGWEERINTYDPITKQGSRGTRWDWWSYYWDPIYNATIVDDGGNVVAQNGVAVTGTGQTTNVNVPTGTTGGFLNQTVFGIPIVLVLAGGVGLYLATRE